MKPLSEMAAVLFQKKRSHTETLAYNAMRIRISRRTCDPLLSNLVLCAGEPFLRQHFYQSRLKIKNEQRKGGIILAHRLIAGWDDQFVDSRKLARHFDLVRPRSQGQRNLKIRNRSAG